MKRLLNYIIILSLPLFVFGCRELTDASSRRINDYWETSSEVSSGPTIDENSDEFDYIEETEKGIIHYKGVPFNGSVTKTYDNGQLRNKRIYKDGKYDGSLKSYYENGQLREKGTYKDGIRNGPYEWYYKNGQLKGKTTYKDGNKDGAYEWYYENGQLKYKGTYKNGEEDVTYELYNEDGTRSN